MTTPGVQGLTNEVWRPDAPTRLVTRDTPTPFPWAKVTLGVLGGLVGACVLIVLILRVREGVYRARAGAWAARRAAAALGLTRAEASLAKKLAGASGTDAAAVLVSGEAMRASAITLVERGISASEHARVAAMCERYGVKAPEARTGAGEKPTTPAQSAKDLRHAPKNAPAMKAAHARAPAPSVKRKAG